MIAAAERNCGPPPGLQPIERLLQQRGIFLLVDAITHVDRLHSRIACRYRMERAAPILAGHFPGEPVGPGALQVEAIGQAGLCLIRLRDEPRAEAPPQSSFALTQILAANFARPITPGGGDVEILARVIPDGLFTLVMGQCLQDDAVCSVAVLRGISKETEI
jgi:3-hydroxyacyl-[acyl-carrier-protein] dehydratase